MLPRLRSQRSRAARCRTRRYADLYPHLQNLTAMKPVVVDPSISLEQLFEEFARVEEDAHRAEIRDQILVKLRRRLRTLSYEARQRYEASAGEVPELTLERLEKEPLADMAAWARSRPGLGRSRRSFSATGLIVLVIDIHTLLPAY